MYSCASNKTGQPNVLGIVTLRSVLRTGVIDPETFGSRPLAICIDPGSSSHRHLVRDPHKRKEASRHKMIKAVLRSSRRGERLGSLKQITRTV
uniref:Uncharacterized protein n=1 Tax=Arundo donax TaxID=35708 RepID=A0A0A9E4C9_ARUDO